MKRKILILTLLVSFINYGQDSPFFKYQKGKILLTNGTEKVGVVKLSENNNKVKFKKSLGDKNNLIFDNQNIDIINFEDGTEYVFKVTEEWETLLLEKLIEGKLSLYSKQTTYYNPGLAGGGLTGVREKSTIIRYYILSEGTHLVKKLPYNYGGYKFRKLFKKYAKNCDSFTEKIKTKKSIKKHFGENIIKMVNDYNENCN